MAISPTTSPYLAAMRAAAHQQHRPNIKSDTPASHDQCMVCGNLTAAGYAYCSDACRDQDQLPPPPLHYEQHPSPWLSPALTAVPPLVPSRRKGGKRSSKKKANEPDSSPPSSATSSPSKVGEGDEDDEEDIEKLVLPPPSVGSFSNKKNNFNYAYTYGLVATSPTVARSPVRSPTMRPLAGLTSPSMGPVSHPMQSRTSQQSFNQQTVTPPVQEFITFRRKFNPEANNPANPPTMAAKPSQHRSPVLSPALVARRRSANINPANGDATAAVSANANAKPVCSPRLSPTVSTSPIKPKRPTPPMTSSGSSAASRSDVSLPSPTTTTASTSSTPARKPKPNAVTYLMSVLGLHNHHQHTQSGMEKTTVCTNKDCPAARPARHPTSTLAHPLSIASFQPLQRRISEPQSPYKSPRILSTSREPFESEFITEPKPTAPVEQDSTTTTTSASRRVSTSSYNLRRPSLSSSVTAPAKAATRPQDYSGFAGFLAAVHNGEHKEQEIVIPEEVTESGYEAHDERRKPKADKATSVQPPASKSAIKREKFASIISSSSSSSDSAFSTNGTKPTRFYYGRGAAVLSTMETKPNPATTTAKQAQQAPPTNYVVKAVSQQKSSHRAVQETRRMGTDSALASSSSSEDETKTSTRDSSAVSRIENHKDAEDGNDSAERGRQRRKSSKERRALVSPFTALDERARREVQFEETDDRHREEGRGRSKQRRGPANMHRSVSPARSSSRASARDRRVAA